MRSGLVAGSEDHARGFRRIVELLILLVILPTTGLLALGILMLIFWQARATLVFGILVVILVGFLGTGTVLALVLLHREARLSKLQLDFVSKVSHELRTPLTSIRMFAETLQLQRTRDEKEMQLCLDVLQKETSRLSKRIERLLDWGRMEAGRRIYRRQPEPVEGILKDAPEAFRPTIVGQEQQVEVDIPPGLPQVTVDRAAIVDALVNLLANAYKYTGDDRKITLGATSGRKVRISVKDNGIGIPRREHRNIFKKFYRVDELLSSATEGSGLGLAIVQHVVAGNGGRIEVDSEPGQGSTFTIVLPRSTNAELAAQNQAAT